MTTDPRPAVSHWEHFGVVTVFWLLYLLLFDSLLYHIFSFCLPLSPLILPPLHLLPPPQNLLLTTNLLSGKAKSETRAFREAVKLIRGSLDVKSITNKNPLVLESNLHDENVSITKLPEEKTPELKNAPT